MRHRAARSGSGRRKEGRKIREERKEKKGGRRSQGWSWLEARQAGVGSGIWGAGYGVRRCGGGAARARARASRACRAALRKQWQRRRRRPLAAPCSQDLAIKAHTVRARAAGVLAPDSSDSGGGGSSSSSECRTARGRDGTGGEVARERGLGGGGLQRRVPVRLHWEGELYIYIRVRERRWRRRVQPGGCMCERVQQQ